MHIKEVDEHLDYHAYWHIPDDVTDVTKFAGNRMWPDIEGIADHYPCPPCKPGAQALTHGGHDVVNILLGKQVHTPQHFKYLMEMTHEPKVEAKYRQLKGQTCHGANCKRATHVG